MVRPGAVFVIEDSAINFPESQIVGSGERTKHPTRRAIVVNSEVDARRIVPKSVLVVPCSASQSGLLGPWLYELPENEACFSSDRVVALAHLLQPILKSKLRTFLGMLSPATFLELQAVIVRNLGFVDEKQTALPPG
jgi:hypothetical protein